MNDDFMFWLLSEPEKWGRIRRTILTMGLMVVMGLIGLMAIMALVE